MRRGGIGLMRTARIAACASQPLRGISREVPVAIMLASPSSRKIRKKKIYAFRPWKTALLNPFTTTVRPVKRRIPSNFQCAISG